MESALSKCVVSINYTTAAGQKVAVYFGNSAGLCSNQKRAVSYESLSTHWDVQYTVMAFEQVLHKEA